MLQRGEPPEQAEGAFSIEFGHIPLGGTEHLHEPLRRIRRLAQGQRLPHTPERFRAWVKNDYRASRPSDRPASLADRPTAAALEVGRRCTPLAAE